MKTIAEGRPEIVKLLPKQPVRHVIHRRMKYSLSTECSDGILLHNVITGKLVLLTQEEAERLNQLPSADVDWAVRLVEDYFLVPADCDEKDIVSKLRFLIHRLFAPKQINHYVIFTTTNCNARCYYCFEHGCECIDMTPETASQLVRYIIEHSGGKLVILKWFGGEPLMNVEIIDQICAMLRERGKEYVSEMTSNGYLVAEEMIRRAAKEWNLKKIQITLDGTEEVYNRIKAYVSADGSPYRRVMENIQALLDAGIHVTIRLNLDLCNAENLKCLAEELRKEFEGSKNLYVYSSLILRGKNSTSGYRDISEMKKLHQLQCELDECLIRAGLSERFGFPPSLEQNHCSADSGGSRVVYPDGRIFLCDFVQDEEQIGSIWFPAEDEAATKGILEKMELPECSECPLYPSCYQLKHCVGVEDIHPYLCEEKQKKMIGNIKELYRKRTENTAI